MKRVLVAVLDWGLGHAARSIPIIHALQAQGCQVHIASSGAALEFLRREFSGERMFDLPAYNPRYATVLPLWLVLSAQLPRLWYIIRKEHDAVEQIIQSHDIHVLISDNRYGCWSKKIPSVFITHQGNIRTPRLVRRAVRMCNEQLIDHFSEVWVPDDPTSLLSGTLSSFEEYRRPPRATWIGLLSGFKRSEEATRYHIAGICSGPEPQRTALEKLLRQEFERTGVRSVLVCGKPGETEGDKGGQQLDILPFAERSRLQEIYNQSEYIVGRSGYSTILDVYAAGKKAIFIPTPGQTEQCYLAERLMEKGIAFSMPQNKFDLRVALQEAPSYSGFHVFPPPQDLLTPAIHRLLS